MNNMIKGDVKGKEKRGKKRKYKEEKDRKIKFEESEPNKKLSVNESKPFRQQQTGQTDVALTIAKRLFLKKSNKDKNIVFSPLSLHVLLSIIAAGSDGSTLDQLLSFLRSSSLEHLNSSASQLISVARSDASSVGGPELRFASGVWVEQSLAIHHSFKRLVATDYDASLTSVDFLTKAGKVVDEVNLWVQKETDGLVKDLVNPRSVNSSTRLIFANALYFKGKWFEKFDASMTRNYDFHLLNGTSVKVPFMVSKKKQFISTFNGFKVLGLPYKQGEDKRRFFMYIFLPNAKDGLSALVAQLTSNARFFESKLPRQKVEVGDFRIPKFKISFGFEASVVLKELGVVLPFSSKSNLRKMVDSDLYVSNIFHKSFIEVNEEGTRAAAASAGIVLKRSLSPRPTRVDFVADHPFFFVIREEMTGTILFTGQVLNPLVR
ncbi:serpin-ZX-like [Lotus japonicus]|uniref:serpin-ZX-like n=1 Tax=Lotus japonicus TaxID=34305 RepID=UPI00258D2501|nr:serpin-ZX-like [Lotus japonicus]